MAVADVFRSLFTGLKGRVGAKSLPAERYAYGKVPGAGDFLRAGSRSPGTNAFEQWLASALATADKLRGDAFRAAYDEDRTWIIQAHFGAADDGRILAGAMRTSRDAVGRRHPLIVGALLPAVCHEAAPELVPLAIAETQREAEAVLSAAKACTSNAALTSHLEALRLPPERLFDDARASWEALLGKGAARFFDDRFPTPAQRIWALHTLREAVTPLESTDGGKSPRPRSPLLLALPDGEGAVESAAFVSRLVRRWGHAQGGDPVLVLRGAGAARRPDGAPSKSGLFFACGETPPLSTMVDVLGAGGFTDTLCDLRGGILPTKGYRTILPPSFEGLAEAPGVTVGSALAALEAS